MFVLGVKVVVLEVIIKVGDVLLLWLTAVVAAINGKFPIAENEKGSEGATGRGEGEGEGEGIGEEEGDGEGECVAKKAAAALVPVAASSAANAKGDTDERTKPTSVFALSF